MGVQTCALPISRTDDGLRLAAFYRPAAPGRKTILFFHGNGDNMIGAIEATREPGAAGHGLMLVEYRGYGGNPGSPGEAGLFSDGEVAMGWFGEAGGGEKKVAIVGTSNGTGAATELVPRPDGPALITLSGPAHPHPGVQRQVPFTTDEPGFGK